ncbi:MAG: MFS transporter [Tomitella sp.]|nr:MFS transporter [Tomitella sp.]
MAHTTTDAAPSETTGPAEISRARLITIFIGLLLGILMAALDQTIVATALPTIAGDLNGLSQISWIITAYLLAQTAAMPIYGKVGDFIGRKNAFQLAIVIFLLGSVFAGLAQTMAELIITRAVQGIGAGGLLIGAQTIMAEIVTPRQRAKYMSVMGPMIGVATVLGPLLGGFLTEQASWRWIFYINVPVGIASMIITSRVLKLPRRSERPRVDWLGIPLMLAVVISLILVLTWGGRIYEWSSPVIIGLIVVVIVLTPLLVWAERRASEPLFPPALFADPVFRINAPLAFLLGLAMFGAVSYLPTYLQLSLGASATKSGILMLPLMGGLMLAAIVTGQVISRTGKYRAFPIIGSTLACVGMYLLSLMNADTPREESSLYMIVLGLGIGFIMPTLVLLVQNSVEHRFMGPATATVNFARQIGASAGTALIGSLFVSRLATDLQQNLPPGAAGKIGKHAQGIGPEQLATLPPDIAHAFVVSYAEALTPLYAYVAPALIIGIVLSLLMKNKPLSSAIGRGPAARADDRT